MKRALLVCLLCACPGKKNGKPQPPATHDDATVADGFAIVPAPPVPAVPKGLPPAPENASITPEAVALGELLFWDTRLSLTNSIACADCHEPGKGFSGQPLSQNSGGKPNLRRASALVNLAWQKEFGWDGRYSSLAEQLAAHLRGQMGDDLATAVTRITDVPGYRAYFTRMGGAPSADAAMTALTAYVLTRYSGDSPWDRVENTAAISAELKAGYQLFTSKAQCAVCHTPPLYTDSAYHRLGLIKTPDEGRGRVDATKQGAFKTPTLRGAVLREAFFHDGSTKSLDEAIDWHLAGGTGHGADPSIVDVKKITLSPKERAQLGTFVNALTDSMAPAMKPQLP